MDEDLLRELGIESVLWHGLSGELRAWLRRASVCDVTPPPRHLRDEFDVLPAHVRAAFAEDCEPALIGNLATEQRVFDAAFRRIVGNAFSADDFFWRSDASFWSS